MNLFLCGLGAYFVAQSVKTVSPWALRPWMKLFWALVGAGGTSAALYQTHFLRLIVFALAGAGLSVLFHRVARVFSLLGDGLITGIMQNYRRR